MAETTPTDLRAQLARYLDLAQAEAVEIRSRHERRRAVLVSTRFYDQAVKALGEIPYNPPELSLVEWYWQQVEEDRQRRAELEEDR